MASLEAYAGLFRSCFPAAARLNARYLRWLYAENPCGPMVGMDAWDGERLAAHYACVPVEARWRGRKCRLLLSLNTATHPDYRGKGLFTRLAEGTFAVGAEQGFAAVHGVANANSTPGFVRKLGFHHLGPLDARIGVGRIDASDPAEHQGFSDFHRHWRKDTLQWRCESPARTFSRHEISGGVLGISAPTRAPWIRVWDERPMPLDSSFSSARTPLIKLHLGLRPKGSRRTSRTWVDVPHGFRASPLNLIFRPLDGSGPPPDARAVYFGVIDFDAF